MRFRYTFALGESMAKTALAVLESALRAKKLDRTLTTALPPVERTDASAFAAVDIDALDACLRGGLPRGQLSEIAGPSSSGRTTLLVALVAAATRRGEIAAVIDTFDRLDIASVAAADTDLARLLWVRGDPCSTTQASLVERAVDRALKAVNLVLQAGGFGVVALDFADVPLIALKRIPFTTWLRIQRSVEGRDTACVLVAPQPMARSAGGVTLTLGGTASWAGDSDRSRHLGGLTIAARVLSPRRTVEGALVIDAGTRGAGPYSWGPALAGPTGRLKAAPTSVCR
jgi:recombination protein RecA